MLEFVGQVLAQAIGGLILYVTIRAGIASDATCTCHGVNIWAWVPARR